MTISWKSLWPVGVLSVIILAILVVTLRPYDGNITALFHLDQLVAAAHPIPSGFVVLTMPGYDGMHYWWIAHQIPDFFVPDRWLSLAAGTDLAYAYQRILLPTFAYLLSFGSERALPWAFLLINIGSLLLAATAVCLSRPGRSLAALAIGLCPAAMVGLHFSLAEPLSLLLTTLFLLGYMKKCRMGITEVICLSLLGLTREVNVLLILFIMGWCAWDRQWRSAGMASIALIVFFAWHSAIFMIFGDMPFFMSTDKQALPLQAMLEILSGVKGWNQFTLSSIALFFGFFLPTLLWTIHREWKTRALNILGFGTLFFLAIMSVMPDHIWGSITSIGRVITPVYPFALLYFAGQEGLIPKVLTVSVLVLGLCAGVGLALIGHPFVVS